MKWRLLSTSKWQFILFKRLKQKGKFFLNKLVLMLAILGFIYRDYIVDILLNKY